MGVYGNIYAFLTALLKDNMGRAFLSFDDNPHSLKEALDATEAFCFGENKGKIDERFFFIMAGFMRTLAIPFTEFAAELKLTQLLVDTGLASSNSEAAKKIKEGAVKLNAEQVKDPRAVMDEGDLFAGKWMLLQKGKGDAAIVMFFHEQDM